MYSIDLEGKNILLTGCEGGLGQVMLTGAHKSKRHSIVK
jgi:hypothetical protein